MLFAEFYILVYVGDEASLELLGPAYYIIVICSVAAVLAVPMMNMKKSCACTRNI